MINTHNEYNGLNKVIELDDFKSECFMKIYKSLDLFDENKASLKTFCITCIKSTALQCLRISRAKKNLLLNSDFTISLEAEINNTDGCDFNEMIEGKNDEYFIDEFVREIKEAFSHLTDREREVIILKMKGYKGKEISKILNTSTANVANRTSNARIKLKKYLNYIN